MLDWYKTKYWSLPKHKMFLNTDIAYHKQNEVYGRSWYRFYSFEGKPLNIFVNTETYVYCCQYRFLNGLYGTVDDALVDLKLSRGKGVFINNLDAEMIIFPTKLLVKSKSHLHEEVPWINNYFANSNNVKVCIDPTTRLAQIVDIATRREYTLIVDLGEGLFWKSDEDPVDENFSVKPFYFDDFIQDLCSEEISLQTRTDATWKLRTLAGIVTCRLK